MVIIPASGGNIKEDFSKMILSRAIAKFRNAHRAVIAMPVVDFCNGFLDTVEGCALQGEAFRDVHQVFKALPPVIRNGLLSTPKAAGGWTRRARFWQGVLKPVLPPRRYYAAMRGIYGAYRYAIHSRRAHGTY